MVNYLTGKIYVSNINGFNPGGKDGDGFISIINSEGTIEELEWAKGLNDPKGMGIKGKYLYVSDVNELVKIDLASGEIASKYPAPGSIFLNDVAVDSKGNIYVSDSEASIVYHLANDTLKVFKEGSEIAGANGLYVENKQLIIGASATGDVKKLNIETGELTELSSGIPNTDGITKDLRGNYFISNWKGEIYCVKNDGTKDKVLDTKVAGINSADITYSAASNLILVPTFFKNSVVAYRINY